jgi:hypothetical protein
MRVCPDEPTLFSTYFPSLEELLLLVYTPIRTIYFFGDIEDERVVKFLNSYKNRKAVGSSDFEIICMKKEV